VTPSNQPGPDGSPGKAPPEQPPSKVKKSAFWLVPQADPPETPLNQAVFEDSARQVPLQARTSPGSGTRTRPFLTQISLGLVWLGRLGVRSQDLELRLGYSGESQPNPPETPLNQAVFEDSARPVPLQSGTPPGSGTRTRPFLTQISLGLVWLGHLGVRSQDLELRLGDLPTFAVHTDTLASESSR
jgi:hypothetical protein